MDMIPLKPERKAQLEEYAKRRGQDPAAALDDALAIYLEWERQDFVEEMCIRDRDYTVRFISNACCRAVKGLPIVLRQDIVFDYLYVKDLVKLTMWFIENEARHRAYNVCSGRPVAITELARAIARVSGEEMCIRDRGEARFPAHRRRSHALERRSRPVQRFDLRLQPSRTSQRHRRGKLFEGNE